MASGSCISEEGLADLWALLNEEFDDMSMTTTTTTDQATTTNDTLLVSLTSQMLYEMLE